MFTSQFFCRTEIAYYILTLLFNTSRRSETSKTRYSRGMLDPICLEATDANMVDWLDDPGVTNNEDISWMDVTIPSEKTLPSVKSTDDDSSDSTDDRGSNDTRGMDENDDL